LKYLLEEPKSNSPSLAPPITVEAGSNALLFPEVHKYASFEPINSSLAPVPILPTTAPSFAKVAIEPSTPVLLSQSAGSAEEVEFLAIII
jgi:hypothetical protein